MTQNFHAVERTSPKGGPFIGTCIKCGKIGLTSREQATEECPDAMTDEEALVALIAQEKTDGK